jgi:hypothetical protein
VKDKVGPMTIQRKSPIVDAANFDSKRLSKNLDEIAILRRYFDEFEAYCKASLTADPKKIVITDGVPIPFHIEGWEMGPGAEKREWLPYKMHEARNRLMTIISDEEIENLKTHTVAAYEKLYANHFGKTTNEVRESFERVMDGLIEKKQNRPSLKRIKNGPNRLKDV